jgi:1,4-alpha-glucan branching enzyme
VNVFHVNDSSKLIGMHRWDVGGPCDDVIVVLNFSNQAHTTYELGIPRGGTWRVRFNSDASIYDAFFGNWLSFDTAASGVGMHGMPVSASIGVGPYTAVILSQD